MTELMEGITVLNQTEIMKVPAWIETMMVISLVVCVISFIACFFVSGKANMLEIVCLITMLISIIAFLISAVCGMVIEEPTGKYKYDCLMSEDVSMTEFYEKYEVLEVNGQIWKIKEK